MSSTVLTLANILYVLVSVAMIVMILLQRGAGAAAGSGFGGGASATVFGSRGASNFLSKSTAILATLFFIISLGMAMYVTRGGLPAATDDLGVMGAAIPAAAPPVDAQIPPSSAPASSAIPAAGGAAEATAEAAVEAVEAEQGPPSEGDSGE
jgi:preprotein translocase subunit SecG